MVSPALGVPEPKAVVSNMEAMAMVIEGGHFLGVLPTHYAEPLERSGVLRELTHPELRWTSEFFVQRAARTFNGGRWSFLPGTY